MVLSLAGSTLPADLWRLDLIAGRFQRLTYSPHPGVDLEQLEEATFWEIEHDGTKRETDLALAKDSSGKAFAGFDNGKEGTWLMGLMCGTCTNPAPIMLTILEPTE